MNPTLTELENQKKDVSLTEEQQKQAAEAEAARKAAEEEAQRRQEGQLTEEELQKQAEEAAARLAELKAIPEDQLTEEQKQELAKLNEASGDDADTEDFWSQVDKLHGDTLQINWDEIKDENGDPIDPLSPQGAFIRERTIAQKAIDDFETHLKQTDSRGYAYILHRRAGGTDEEFFEQKTLNLPSYEEFEKSVDLQRKVYLDDLVRKGVGEKQAKLLVDQAVQDKEIFELADKAYKEQEKSYSDQLKNIEKALQEEEAAYQRNLSALSTMLQEEITSNANMKIVIPANKKAEFNQFVRSKIQTSDGRFYVVDEIGKESLPRILEAMYLQFVKGDLSGLVARRAMTQTTQRLRLEAKKDDKRIPGKQEPTKGRPTLGEL